MQIAFRRHATPTIIGNSVLGLYLQRFHGKRAYGLLIGRLIADGVQPKFAIIMSERNSSSTF